MIKSKVFTTITDISNKKFPSDGMNSYKLFYGYSVIATMNPAVLNSIFNEEELKELEAIKDLIASNGIDMALVKGAIPILSMRGFLQKENLDMTEDFDQLNDHSTDYDATDILKLIIRKYLPDKKLFQNGSSMEAVYEVVKSIPTQKRPAEKEEVSESSESGDRSEEHVEKTLPKEADSVIDEEQGSGLDALLDQTQLLYEELQNKIIGQNEAIRMFAEGYFQSEVFQDKDPEKKGPGASFLFAGPPGVGKTYLASCAAETLGRPFLRVDLSEYCTPDSVHKLTGVPKTFAAPCPGILTEFVREHKKCVVLLDEIEKAHEDVIHQFLQVLDGGMLTDGFTSKEVSFKDSILIFTSNVGASLYENHDRQNLSSLPKYVVLKALEQETDKLGQPVFPPAIVSRFASGNLIMFNYLGVNELLKIANSRFEKARKVLEEIYGYDIKIDPQIATVLLYAQSTGMDARNISNQSTILLQNELYEFGRHVQDRKSVFDKIKTIRFSVDTERLPDDIKNLFVNDKIMSVLYVGEEQNAAQLEVPDLYKVFHADNLSKVEDILAKENIDFAIVDVLFKKQESVRKSMSMDDINSEGNRIFFSMRERYPHIPVYLADHDEISGHDKATFYELGARGFLYYRNNPEYLNEVASICSTLYMQKQIDLLSGRGRVLSYNSAQYLSDDGESVEIIFYDFKAKMAANAEENSLLLSDADKPKEHFSDVIGAENAKAELMTFVKYLNHPKKYLSRGISIPKGVLLFGPPGTGKTMLARAMAGEVDATFIPTSASAFGNKYVGESEKQIRRIFATARKFAPSIIFIDEIDAIGKERTGSEFTHHTEGMLNALLTEMDGFEVNAEKPVFVIAATNFDVDGRGPRTQSRIDPALVRRFDNKIYVDLPKENERKQFLEVQLRQVKDSEVSEDAINNIAMRTTGESLAILKNVLKLAIRNAGRKGVPLNDEFLINALDEYMYGEQNEWREEYYNSVAIHESGHAYIAYLSGKKPSFVTIISRGTFGGYMMPDQGEDTPTYTKQDLIWQIRTALAGRAAELEFFGEEAGINTGVSSDLQRATNIAFEMMSRYGMKDGSIVSLPAELLLRSTAGPDYIQEVNDFLMREMKITRELIAKGREAVKRLADYLKTNNQAPQGKIEELFSI